MTESAHQSAMQARIEHDSLDSVAPFDFDVERGEQWPMPEVKPWAPKPSLWARLHRLWLGGAA